MKRRTKIVLGLAAVAGGVALSRVLGSTPTDPVGGPLEPCADGVPNCERVAVWLEAPPERVRRAVRRAVRTHGSVWTGTPDDVVERDGQVEALVRVGLFHDRLTVAVEADGDASVLWVRSASEVGRSDLGVNRARVRALVAAVRADLAG